MICSEKVYPGSGSDYETGGAPARARVAKHSKPSTNLRCYRLVVSPSVRSDSLSRWSVKARTWGMRKGWSNCPSWLMLPWVSTKGLTTRTGREGLGWQHQSTLKQAASFAVRQIVGQVDRQSLALRHRKMSYPDYRISPDESKRACWYPFGAAYPARDHLEVGRLLVAHLASSGKRSQVG